MGSSNPQPMRVLVRPPIPPQTTPSPPPQPAPSTNAQTGVMVVGFMGKRHTDTTYLINRIIDANVFGSGNLDIPFIDVNEDLKSWFECRNISYFHEEEKGILYLQFSSRYCPVVNEAGFSESQLDELEFAELQGMLFMFSVCHVIIYIQEGSRFNTQILQKFRVLQAAKHAMAPFVKSQTSPSLTARSRTSASSRTSSAAPSSNPSPGRARGVLNRNASAISLMSGLGSYASLLPGHCVPVILFVFLDDLGDFTPDSSLEESIETSSNQATTSSSSNRLNSSTKGSSSIVVLARPPVKSEGGLRKKLQSSLEGQIRFSIKKCRILFGSETSNTGSRSGGISSSTPLFSLDATRAVSLLDISANQRGESLEFATCLVDDILNGKATSESLLLESHGQSANKEDMLSVKEFIYRQSDILRGRGGLVSSSGSAGVGMVAVAAAAAAASAASGKTFAVPELPSFEMWLSSSQVILCGIVSANCECLNVSEVCKLPQERSSSPPVEGNPLKPKDPLDIAVSYLESGGGLNTKFSTTWCEKALPLAKEIYLDGLPPCYPTSTHKAHLEKALQAFNSMVKGPAVHLYLKRLKNECVSIWSSGRQLCDAVSLTGKPCMHQRHNVEAGGSFSAGEFKSHSSGYQFLHACACGRSRRLRPDPFDFEAANVTYSCFPDCDKLLPALHLPQGSMNGPIHASSWTLIRVGSSKYYQPSKGLLQSGFCATQKFLFKMNILQKQISSGLPEKGSRQVLLNGSSSANVEFVEEKTGTAQFFPRDVKHVEKQNNTFSEYTKAENKGTTPGGVTKFTMRKPFSEVVAGSSAADPGFPPLKSRQPALTVSETGVKQFSVGDSYTKQTTENAYDNDCQKRQAITSVDLVHNGNETGVNANTNTSSQIHSHTGVNIANDKTFESEMCLKHVTIYIGFEHECPYGHRFILSPDHLKELGSPYAIPEEPVLLSSAENLDRKVGDIPKVGKNSNHGKSRRHSNGMISASASKNKSFARTKLRLVNGNVNVDGPMHSRLSKERTSTVTNSACLEDLDVSLLSFSLDDGACASSLLNRSLPIYMNCPHCKNCKDQIGSSNIQFAGTISQLQRIFLVTPPLPVVLVACPIIQFESSCLLPSVPANEQKLQFDLGCQVILPPESFLSLRLPFVYGVKLEDGILHPLKPFADQPQLTAWIVKGTMLQVMYKGRNLGEDLFIKSEALNV